jgi:hypothetical protein
MIRNAPHRAEIHRRIQVVNNGIPSWTDQLIGTVAGRFAVTDLDPASPGAATGSGQASFYLDHGHPATEDDLLVLTAPELGTWRVMAARWSPSSQRLLLSRV